MLANSIKIDRTQRAGRTTTENEESLLKYLYLNLNFFRFVRKNRKFPFFLKIISSLQNHIP